MFQRSYTSFFALTVLLSSFSAPTFGQVDAFAEPVAQLVAVIQKESQEASRKSKVLIIPFALSAQLHSRLQNSDAFEMIDPATVNTFFRQNYLNAGTLRTPTAVVWVAEKMGADLVLQGQVAGKRREFDLRIDVYDVNQEKRLAQIRSIVRKTDETKDIRTGNPMQGPDESGVYGIGTGGALSGLGAPKCESCGPPFPAGSDVRWEGTVTLLIVVNEEGRVVSVVPLQKGPPKFTDKAIETVRGWKLSPLKGPEGKPLLVRTMVEVVFRQH